MEKIMAVITREKQFSERLCDYVNKKNDLVLTAIPFENMGACASFSENHPLELVLADRDLFGKDTYTDAALKDRPVRAGRTILLDDGSGAFADPAEQTEGIAAVIQKYQPADSLIRSIMESCRGVEFRKTAAAIGRPVRILGVYSPADRSAGCAFAMTLSRIISSRRRTLYLNLGEFSGLGRLMGERFDSGISEALYQMKQGNLTPDRIHSMIYSYEGIDYIPPVRFADDRNSIHGEDYGELIGMILKGTAYETVVIEMQSFAGEASEVMDLCDTVYMPVGSHRLSVMQADEFCEYLQLSHREMLLQKIERVRLPDDSFSVPMGSYLDGLVYGPIGDVIRELGET